MVSYTFDAPPLGATPTDPVSVLARCATLDDVHGLSVSIRDLLTPALGPAASDGATREVVRAFAQLLHHPLGPSVAAEALGLAGAGAGLMTSHHLAAFFSDVLTSRRSLQPLSPTEQRLIRERLEQLPSPRRRLDAVRIWWRSAHRPLDLFLGDMIHGDWFDLDPWALLALAPADRLVAQMRWMSPEANSRVVAHPLLFSQRDDAEQLAELVLGHLDAAATNPACTPRVLRHLATRPVPEWEPPTGAATPPGAYVVPNLDTYDWWRNDLPPTRLGWLHLPAQPVDVGAGADLALIAGHDRPPTALCHVAGDQDPWAEGQPIDVRNVQAMVEALDGTTVEADGTWTVTVLRTREAIVANAGDMGNCTASLYAEPEECGMILCRVTDGESVLNAAVHPEGDSDWFLAEINSRWNRAEVAASLRWALEIHIGRLSDRARSRAVPVTCSQCGVGRPARGTVCLDCRTGQWDHLERWVYAA
jgi:hypothetical protein